MRRQNLPFDSELRHYLMNPSEGVEDSNHGQNMSDRQEEVGHPSRPATSAPQESVQNTRSNPSPKRNSAKKKSSSKCSILCRLFYNLLNYVIATFWGLCTAWILVLVLVYLFYGTTLALVLALVAILGLAYNIQDKLLYFPDEPESSRFYVAPPQSTGLPYEDLYLQTSDRVRVSAVLFKQAEPLFSRAPTVLFFHGNAGNIAHRYFNAHGLYAMCGCNILFLEYRGFGRSEGRPSEAGFYLDAQAALDYLHRRGDIDTRRIVVFGRSLGGAVAINLASQTVNRGKIAGLVIENTFTSIPDMGTVIFRTGLLRWVPLFLVKNQYFSINKVKHIRTSTLFISGVEDELVPSKMMHELFLRCGTKNKQLIRFEGGTHNETWRCHGYFTVLREFLTQATYRETQLIKDLPVGAQRVRDTSETSTRHHIETV
ncbi:protein ABHD13-like [Patiria miniata]|uniref:Serine aminopeptidase S33 domain-containing protein n=1 Tax=Patiria miniata TaxID=46514 RepID=A0A913ZIY7_PATMI|nr:protein ABHD13-like [Patiria miniata]